MDIITIEKYLLLESEAFKESVKIVLSDKGDSEILKVLINWEGQEYEFTCKEYKFFDCIDVFDNPVILEPAEEQTLRESVLAALKPVTLHVTAQQLLEYTEGLTKNIIDTRTLADLPNYKSKEAKALWKDGKLYSFTYIEGKEAMYNLTNAKQTPVYYNNLNYVAFVELKEIE